MIRNNLKNRILIQLKGGKSIDLLEKSTVEIMDDDLLSSHLQNLIQRGLVTKEKETKKAIEKEGKVENPKKETKNEVDEDLSDEKEIKDKTDEDYKKETETGENLKKENEVNEDLFKEIKVKSGVNEKSEQKKSNNVKKGK